MYRISTSSLHKREVIIKDAVQASYTKYTFFEYQNRKQQLPVIPLDIGVPTYRLNNYRTRAAHFKYISEHKKPSNFFESSQENETVQQIQHDILLNYAKQGRSGSITPIYEELKVEEQREPLLITFTGIVVNGNRRLAAMRHLYAVDPTQFRRFSHIDCAVLPINATLDEVREIEIRLQMSPETKLPYEWVNESLAIQDLLLSGKNIDQIADLMKKRKIEVQRADRALTEAEIYLKDWLQKPREYQFVEDAEQFFGDLAKSLAEKQGDELEISRRFAWALLSNSSNLGRRVYDYNFSFTKRTNEVISSLTDRLEIDLDSTTERSLDRDEDEDIEIVLDPEPDTSLNSLIESFDDPSQREFVADELIDVCNSILEQDKQGEIGRRALVAIQNANKQLQGVDLTKAASDTYSQIDKQLDSVIERASNLKKSLKKYVNE